MRQYSNLLIFIFILIGCEKVIDLDLEFTEKRIVIDAKINKHINSDDGFAKVIISETTSYFEEEIIFVENEIDQLTARLSPLRNFVIPGGHIQISYSHIARCICRRAERNMTELNQEIKISPLLIAYINRLSDYLFTLSRSFANELNIEEIKWKGNKFD